MLHYVSAFLELDEKIQPTIELSPSTNTISFKDINSTGRSLKSANRGTFEDFLVKIQTKEPSSRMNQS